jgi:MoxR-like ATPase
MLAKALARSIDCSFSRLQFTPDLLPSDVTGVNVFNQTTNEFEFRPGPCSRTCCSSTRSTEPRRRRRRALLEAMQENQVTVDGVSYELAAPFMVLRDAEPDRVRGHVPAARGPARPLRSADRDRLPAAAGGGADADGADERPAAGVASARGAAADVRSLSARRPRCSSRRA